MSNSGTEASLEVWAGQPYPLGATLDEAGTNFSLFSEVAERVELCLFDEAGNERRVVLPEVSGSCWHGYVPGVGVGQRYGYRVYGKWAPEEGARANPSKLLLDPYARAISGSVRWDEAVFPYRFDDPDGAPSDSDSAPFVPRAVVCGASFDWSGERRPRTRQEDTIIYELHVKAFTARHPGIPPELRGTYAGLAHPAAIDHLRRLGVSAVELMPVHQFLHDKELVARGLNNFWGYNSLGYFAPHNEYSSAGDDGAQVREFQEMVKTLHNSGIQVILDVVYNHTAEGNHLGPMLAYKGIDNAAYYRLAADRRFVVDTTGAGNSLNMRHPHVLQLIMDSLRYWVIEMHVDGFRFDLAATLARELHEVDRLSAFFDLVQQDPVVSQVLLIAEPWDLGEGGYQVGKFPPLWSEWNGRYRDTVRDFWRGAEGKLSELAYRLTGSSDLYQNDGRRPHASVNFVTCHDGSTLHDLVSYNQKHNQANGEDNRDGSDDNRSWNCGAEGPTDDPGILTLRARQKRNFLATLLLSQGIPLLLSGDELGRTQHGNNNAYCQDNEISWLDWEAADSELLEWTRKLMALRRAHPGLRRRGWFKGRPIHGGEVRDIAWFTPGGTQMSEDHWGESWAKSLGLYLNGSSLLRGVHGEEQADVSLYLMLNAHSEALEFKLPAEPWGPSWERVLDTRDAAGAHDAGRFRALDVLSVEASSLVLLRAGD